MQAVQGQDSGAKGLIEAYLTLNCSPYSENIEDILKLFQQIGWGIFNLQGKVEYLPVGDDDEFNWQCEEISESKLYSIVADKISQKEQIGINLFHDSGNEGISFVAHSTEQIILSIGIHRKLIKESYTDTVWYLENIIYKLFDVGVRLLSYKLEEFED